MARGNWSGWGKEGKEKIIHVINFMKRGYHGEEKNMKGILCVLIVVAQGGGGAREWVDINLVFVVVVVFLQCVAILRKLKERIS